MRFSFVPCTFPFPCACPSAAPPSSIIDRSRLSITTCSRSHFPNTRKRPLSCANDQASHLTPSWSMNASTLQGATTPPTEVDVEDDPDMVIVKVEDETSSVSTLPSAPALAASESPRSLDLSADTEPLFAKVPEKKKRGRPRKNPPKIKSKTLVRSKTGCITCRRRKKKCDERRPGCRSTTRLQIPGLLLTRGLGFNCQNTGCLCDGYIEPQEWQQGVKQEKELGMVHAC